MDVEHITQLLKDNSIRQISINHDMAYHKLYNFIRKNNIPYKGHKDIDRNNEIYSRGRLS